MRKTTFAVTSDALKFENLLLSRMDIPRTTFHRRMMFYTTVGGWMIAYFFKNEIEVHPYLLITEKKDKNYVNKDAVEQIYLDEQQEVRIKDEANKYGCRIGVILFQAMMSYCIAIASDVLGKEEIGKLFVDEG